MTDQKYIPTTGGACAHGVAETKWYQPVIDKRLENAEAINQERQRLRDAVVDGVAEWYTLRGSKHTSRLRIAYQELKRFERLHVLENK